jgi:hypothetical protein
MTYVKRPGITKNGKINIETGKFRSVNVNAKAILQNKNKVELTI